MFPVVGFVIVNDSGELFCHMARKHGATWVRGFQDHGPKPAVFGTLKEAADVALFTYNRTQTHCSAKRLYVDNS